MARPETLAAIHSPLIIAGPTAAGKTAAAIAVAKALGGEIVGADAFQVYRGLPLLSAKPSPAELSEVPHHLISEIPLTETFDVSQYLELAAARMSEIRARGALPIIVGGTGLYIRALLRGFADLPPADPELRHSLSALSLEEMQQELAKRDPAAYAQIDRNNPRRLIRALEVTITSGKPFSSYRDEWTAAPAITYGAVLVRERTELYARIDRRVEAMFENGVVEEVEAEGEELSATAAQMLGWREIWSHIKGVIQKPACISAIQQATRRYAKRQLTWFGKEHGLKELNLDLAGDGIVGCLEKLYRERS